MYHNGCQFSGSKVSISELTPKAVAFTLTVEPTPIPDDSRFLLDLRREARTSFPMKLVEKENKGAEGERLQAFRAGWENCSTPFTAMRKTVSSNSSCACYCLVLPGRPGQAGFPASQRVEGIRCPTKLPRGAQPHQSSSR